jgi:hypothetical protein
VEWAFKKKNEMALPKTLKNIKSFDIPNEMENFKP